jgi:tol-pal system protein YbgF
MMRFLGLALVCLLALSQVAHAALFDDEGARKKIVELQQQIQVQDQTLTELKKSQQAMEERMASMETVVKGQGLADLLSQIQQLNEELRRVKGDLEVATHNIDTAQQRQKDLYGDIDSRLRKLEGGTIGATAADAPSTALPGAATISTDNGAGANGAATQAKDTEGLKDLEAAQSLSRAGKHREAFEAYDKFLQTYPASTHVAEAQYALGYSQFSLKNYKASIATQQKLLQQFPNNSKAPDALFNIANSQIQLADIDGAKKTLRSLLSQYPSSELASSAKKRLVVLESIKSK